MTGAVKVSRTFLRVEGLSNDFSHIQQPCFFSRVRVGWPSCLVVVRDPLVVGARVVTVVTEQALRIDCVMSARVGTDDGMDGPGKVSAPGKYGGGPVLCIADESKMSR